MNPDDRALALAARIADGSGIDWPSTEAAPADADERALLEELKAIAEVATVHRTPADWPTDSASLAGTRWGPLTLLAKVGEGRFGDVYAAWDARLQRRVALKLLRAASPAASASPTSAIEEARLLARVRHPNVLTVHGAEAVDGQVGIWTEFIEGRTLERLLAERGPLPPEEVVAIGLDLCRALGAVHEAGLLHRDIKAQNVMREIGGRIVLMDFGTGHDLDTATNGGDLSGTPLYLAPELFAGGRPSAATDLYALAVLLFYLLTGRHPVAGRTLDDVRAGHRDPQPTRLRDLCPDLPEVLSAAIERGLAIDPAARYDSARAFEAALGRAQTASPQSNLTQAARWPWRHPRGAAAAALVVVIAALSVAYVTTLHHTGTGPVSFQARDWVLVTTFDNRTADPQFDGTLESALTYELSNSAYVNVVPRERIDDTLRLMARPTTTVVDPTIGREVAVRDGRIRLVLDGGIERADQGYAVTVRVVEPHTAATIARDREIAPAAANVSSAVRRLSSWIRVTLGEAPATVIEDDARLARLPPAPSLRAVALVAEAGHAANLSRFAESEALLESALAADPNFAMAHLRMAWTLQNLGRPRDQVLASIQRALNLVDTVTERERYAILGAYYWMTNRNALAIGQFEALTTRFPDDSSALRNLFELYSLANRREEAADVMTRVANERPNDFDARVRAAQALLETRGLDAARPETALALRLLPTAPNVVNGAIGPAKTWLLMFPVHDLWTQGRGKEAAAALDAAMTRSEIRTDNDLRFNILGKLRIALGQLRLAQTAYSEMTEANFGTTGLAEVALARGDLPGVVAHLSSFQGTDLLAVSLLVRAGDLDDAEKVLRRIPNSTPMHFQWAADDIAEARGDTARVMQGLKAGVPWTHVMTGARAFLYSETLARAAVKAGDTADAIGLLEETAALGPRAYAPVTQSGFYWMRIEKLLADLYRQTGQIDKARAVERDLLSKLAAADDDYPLLVELRARAGNTTAPSTPAPPQPPAREIRPPALVKITFPRLWTRLGFPSHDGRFIPFIDDSDEVEVFEVSTGRSRQLTEADPSGGKAIGALMSSNGDRVVYARSLPGDAYELRVVNADGTSPHLLIPRESAYVPVAADWSRDGRDILCWFRQKNGTADLMLVPVDGGAPRLLQTFANSPPASLSPDGRFVVTHRGMKGPHYGDLLIIGTDGSEPRVLLRNVDDDKDAMWTPDGAHVFFLRKSPDVPNASDGWVAPVADGAVHGEVTLVARNLGSLPDGFGPLVSLTDDGRLYRIIPTQSTDVYTASIDLTGTAPLGAPTRIASAAVGDHVGPAWSPDGRSIAFFSTRPALAAGALPLKTLQIKSTSSGAVRDLQPRLAFLGGYSPHWAPDSQSVIVWGEDEPFPDRLGYYRVDVHSSVTSPVFVVGRSLSDAFVPGSFQWSPDGRDVLYVDPARGIVARDLATSLERILVPSGSSPDLGRFAMASDGSIAFVATRDGERVLEVRSAAGTFRDLLTIKDPERLMLQTWTPDGQQVLYTTGTGSGTYPLRSISSTGGEPHDLHLSVDGNVVNPVSLSPDGRQIAYTERARLLELWITHLSLDGPGAGAGRAPK